MTPITKVSPFYKELIKSEPFWGAVAEWSKVLLKRDNKRKPKNPRLAPALVRAILHKHHKHNSSFDP